MSRWRSKSLFFALLVTVAVASTAHAQTVPGATSGGLTVTLPTAEGAAKPSSPAISQMGVFDPSIARAWFQAFVLPGWRITAAPATQPAVRTALPRHAARTR